MKITCVGGGPAGLTFAILAALAGHEVTVVERTEPDESFGWGVVFWDDLVDQLDASDPATAALLRDHAYRWTDQVVTVRRQGAPAERQLLPSTGYSMRRARLLRLLRDRATAVGVSIVAERFEPGTAVEADLVIGGDGVNSGLRRADAGFGTRFARRSNKYIWLGTDREFTSFTFPFVQTDAGWLWAHAYGFDADASTFVVETTVQTWRALGFDTLGPAATMAALESIFDAELDGHALRPQAGTRDQTPWSEFLQVTNEHWQSNGIVLLGDAAHTTHFTIGSGTRLAMEDALVLAAELATASSAEAGLTAYEQRRKAELAATQRQADASAAWYEQIDRYVDRPVADFAKLMEGRRSPIMARVPVGPYLALTKAADRVPVAGRVARRLARMVAS